MRFAITLIKGNTSQWKFFQKEGGKKKEKEKPDPNIWLSSRLKDNFRQVVVVLHLQFLQKVHSRFPTRQNFLNEININKNE